MGAVTAYGERHCRRVRCQGNRITQMLSANFSCHVTYPWTRGIQIINWWWSENNLLLFSHYIMSDPLRPHGLQHARFPCPFLSVCSNSCPLSWWCYLTISSSATHFSFCLQSFPAPGSFAVSWICTRWPKYWSSSFSISPSNEYSGRISFRIDWFDLLAVQGTLKSSPAHRSQPCHSKGAWVTQWSYKPCHAGPPEMDRSQWRILTTRSTLEKGMANHSSILALRTPWTVWKGK